MTSVDISWGAMEYEYSNGTWNVQTHSYDGAGWTDNGTGFVTLKNTGETQTTAVLSYSSNHSDIVGNFTDGSVSVLDTINLTTRQEKTIYLVLSGKPSEDLSNATIGTVTVRIGGE